MQKKFKDIPENREIHITYENKKFRLSNPFDYNLYTDKGDKYSKKDIEEIFGNISMDEIYKKLIQKKEKTDLKIRFLPITEISENLLTLQNEVMTISNIEQIIKDLGINLRNAQIENVLDSICGKNLAKVKLIKYSLEYTKQDLEQLKTFLKSNGITYSKENSKLILFIPPYKFNRIVDKIYIVFKKNLNEER